MNNFMKQFNLLIIAFLLGSITVFSQQIEVSGTITDESGGAIPGVSVEAVGTELGAQSDFDGNYNIKVESGTKLRFSYVGMKTLTKVVSDAKLDITLAEDILGLEEVIITGTSGVARKKQLGSAISTVSAKNLSDSKANVSIGEALQGQVAGAKINRNSGDPSGGISIQLRGNSTISPDGSSDPLYIIDGVFINNSSSSLLNLGGNTQNRLVDIDPEDIDRIEILKGAAAAAIYGSRAANGVVQIFTKRGKTGEPKISFSTSFNANSIREYLPYNDTQLAWDGDNAVPAERYNYQDYIFQNSTGFQNNLSISGANEKTGYSISLSQYENEGIVKNTDFSRKSGRIRIDQKVYDWMDVSIGSYFSNSFSNDMPNGANYGPITSLLFADNINDASPDEFGNYPNIGWMANPNESIDRIKASQEYFRSISDIQVKIKPFTGATINYTFGLDNSNGEGLLFIPYGFSTFPNGRNEKTTSKTLLYNSDLNLSYSTSITDDIKSTTGFGYSYQYQKNDIFGVQNIIVPPLDGIISITPDLISGGIDLRTESALWGGYLQQHFAYKDQLFLTLAGRMDGASTFGVDDRQQFYPKVSASYSISDADFWNDNIKDIIGTLKLRTAWGQAGNLSALGPNRLYTTYDPGAYGGNLSYFPNELQGSADLKPERQTELEFGFDMALLNDKIGIEFSYYNQDIQDLLLRHDLSPSTGFAARFDNIGSMTNKGYEILVRAKPVSGDFNWGISGTFSTNKNNVTSVVGGKLDLAYWGRVVAITDQPLGVFYGTYIARDDAGNAVLDANGFVQSAKGSYEEITLSDGETYFQAVQEFDPITGQPTGTILKKVVGDPNPDFVASLTNTFKYKDFSLRIQFDTSQGGDVLSWDKRMQYLFAGGEATGLELSGEIPKGSSSAKFGIEEAYIEDGSYVKLREVALSYDLKLNKSYIKSIKLTASGNNLISWDNHWGFDPEINTGGQINGVSGVQMGSVPIPRVFKLGAKFNF